MRPRVTLKEAIDLLENIDRFDPYHLDRNEFTEDDHTNIQKVISWLKFMKAMSDRLEEESKVETAEKCFGQTYEEFGQIYEEVAAKRNELPE